MINHYTLVIIRKVGDPRIETIHDKVDKIEFVGNELHVVLTNGVVHHYPASSYVFELIDSLNYYNNKPFTVFFVDGFSNIDKIMIIPESDISKFIIQRTDHEDLVINVNGGTYRND